ncbi:hypothetical protein [Yoonia vestfoldensis]|jgi:predicted  nucleic acid-binding Zn-ribbon protein|uniref:Chromosome segregation protein n=1 Tax=Yoonia vestfoldensis TaxID=245188 RepID=A0A1Y0EC86_9RHOB|nr:hypothetical protein [Yoonia vestfoldensis]ARU01214.1 chromosome segregation protein [Yoonia vestfoldensis]
MTQVAQDEKRYRWIGAAVALVALAGWLVALYFWSAAGEARDRLAQHVTLHGTTQELEQQITTLRAQTQEARTMRDTAFGERDTLSTELDQMRRDFTTLDQDSTALRSSNASLQSALDEGRQNLSEITAALSETQDRATEATQELSDIGARLETARAQEAALRSTLSALNAQAASLTAQAADAEDRIQAARDAEATLEQRQQSARDAQAEIESTRARLQAAVARLSQQRDALVDDAQAARAQVQALHGVTRDLAALLARRSDDLQTIEARISSTQQVSGLALATAYAHDNIRIRFAPDGAFTMRNTRTGRAVTGDYTLSAGQITFDGVAGDTGSAAFPMRCALSIRQDGFALADDDGSCALLDGMDFTRAEG